MISKTNETLHLHHLEFIMTPVIVWRLHFKVIEIPKQVLKGIPNEWVMIGKTTVTSIKKAFPGIEKGFVELRGFEPRTSSLPAKRSSQLSYSPLKQGGLK